MMASRDEHKDVRAPTGVVCDPRAWFDEPDLTLLTAKDIEGQFYERKSKREPDDLAKTICAFANSNRGSGGLLAVGISDDGVIDGLRHRSDLSVNRLLEFHHYAGARSDTKLVDCVNKAGDRDQVLLIYVPYLEDRVAETSKGKAYVRRGDKTEELRDPDRRELEYAKGQISFEDEVAGDYSPADLVDDIVQEYCRAVSATDGVSTTTPPEQVLLSRRLLKKENGRLRVTKAAVVLFSKDPCAHLPGAFVRFLRYSDTERRPGAQHNVVKDEHFRDPLPRLLQRLNDFLRSQLREFTTLGADGKFLQQPEYPEFALHEAIVNALVHRSYSLTNMPIKIEMFEDRIEVTSPGDYPAGVHPRDFVHNPRNPRIMDAMRYLRFVRMLSEGTLRIQKEMETASLPAPEFSRPGNPYVRVVLRNDIERRLKQNGTDGVTKEFSNLFRVFWTHDLKGDELGDSSAPRLAEIKRALVDALRAHGYLVDSFTSDRAVLHQEEEQIPGLERRDLVSVYSGFRFRLVPLHHGMFLAVDHDIEVRNRATLEKVFAIAPEMRTAPFWKAFVKVDTRWIPGRIRQLRKDGHVTIDPLDQSLGAISAPASRVVPNLPTTVVAELLRRARVNVDIHGTVKRLAFNLSSNAARRRAAKTQEIARQLASSVFPIRVRAFTLHLEATPQPLKTPALSLKTDLNDVQPVFSKEASHRASTVLNGLNVYGSYEKPDRELPLVLLCTPSTKEQMLSLVERLKHGANKFRGMEKTFGLSLGEITVVQATRPEDYVSKCRQNCASIPQESLFLVFCPEHGYSRADYRSPYYQVKHFLLEAGFPSQMVDEQTLRNPSWKDYNLALDVFAKAGHVPWVLSEGLPNADLFVGLSYSSISGAGPGARLIGYVNVFDRYGKWLFYKGNAKPIRFDQRERAFRALLENVAREYSKNAKLQRVHVHHGFKLSHQGRIEISSGVRAAAPHAEMSFIHVNQHSLLRLYDARADGDGSLKRGAYVVAGANRFFIATTGDNEFGQKGMGTPRPLDVSVNRVRSVGELDLRVYAQHILSLTRLNWASTKDFCREPITLKFAGDIAYLMNVFLTTFGGFTLHPRLEKTPWFL